jgi:hypothetical protein
MVKFDDTHWLVGLGQDPCRRGEDREALGLNS